MNYVQLSLLCYGLFIASSFLGLVLLGLYRQNRLLRYSLEEAIKQLRLRKVSGGRR